MKLTFKTLQKQQFVLDVDPSTTVEKLKVLIKESQGYDPELQKLIFSGKVLVDEKTIEQIGVKEKDFFVVMLIKPKAAPTVPAPSSIAGATAAASSSATPAPAAAQVDNPLTTSVDVLSSTPAAAEASASAPPDSTNTPAAATQDPGFLTGSGLQTTIDEIVNGMGFPRDQVKKAMQAAFNNPDRAVEYLMTGIPASLDTLANPQPITATTPDSSAAAIPSGIIPPSGPRNLFEAAAQHVAQQRQPGETAAPTTGPAAAGAPSAASTRALEALRNNPQMIQLRQLVQANPNLLQPFLQQLGQSNPSLLAQLTSNPNLLMSFLTEGAEGIEDDAEFPPGMLGAGAGTAGDDTQYVQVSPEERDAIERLVGLGFERALVIQAYFACDKNEDMAANYLIEHGLEDFEDAARGGDA